MKSVALVLVLAASLSSLSAQAVTRVVLNRRIENNQTIARALYDAGLADAQVDGVVSALQGVFDFKRSRPLDQFRVVLTNGELDFFDYRHDALDEYQVRRDGEHFVGSKREIEVEKKVAMIDLTVESSFYESALAAGEDPSIAVDLSDVFAWDIDFYQDVRRGDRARIVVEKFLTHGRLVRYGELLAASYIGESVGKKKVFRYELPTGEHSYFQADGSSARKSFLKSPLKFAHVTSGYGSRYHPILHYVSAHNGVDYAAAVGTPVWAVSDGTVTRAGYGDGNGNHVCIRHASSMESCYLHLSKVAPGVHVGARVSQKQVVAYSGNTGLSTGPHLHFALRRGGMYVNPLNQKFPRADPLPKTLLADFAVKTAPFVSWLDSVPLAAAFSPSISP